MKLKNISFGIVVFLVTLLAGMGITGLIHWFVAAEPQQTTVQKTNFIDQQITVRGTLDEVFFDASKTTLIITGEPYHFSLRQPLWYEGDLFSQFVVHRHQPGYPHHSLFTKKGNKDVVLHCKELRGITKQLSCTVKKE